MMTEIRMQAMLRRGRSEGNRANVLPGHRSADTAVTDSVIYADDPVAARSRNHRVVSVRTVRVGWVSRQTVPQSPRVNAMITVYVLKLNESNVPATAIPITWVEIRTAQRCRFLRGLGPAQRHEGEDDARDMQRGHCHDPDHPGSDQRVEPLVVENRVLRQDPGAGPTAQPRSLRDVRDTIG